jgi:RNA polymerase sigma factor (TIGR02999 family)
MADEAEHKDISRLLQSAAEGDPVAADAVVPLVYDELRAIAAAELRRMRPGGTLDATALVNEAYVRLVGRDIRFENRRHFFFAAARAMRDVLVEHARRGSRRREIETEANDESARRREPLAPADRLIAIDEALPRLQAVEPRAHEVVMLRFFGGLTNEQVGEVLGITTRTVDRDWRFARAWLFEAIGLDEADADGGM